MISSPLYIDNSVHANSDFDGLYFHRMPTTAFLITTKREIRLYLPYMMDMEASYYITIIKCDIITQELLEYPNQLYETFFVDLFSLFKCLFCFPVFLTQIILVHHSLVNKVVYHMPHGSSWFDQIKTLVTN